MVETQRNGTDTGYWGYLINQDKTPARHLEDLCLGLARIICTLDSGPPDRLTPQRLAAFYRSVGGNLDPIFLRTTHSALSFLYRTIGCFHSLEPSSNPFETPSVPCLTPEGFVKWSTVQLLLCPEEHTNYLQQAVAKYDIPRPDGGHFPKHIPSTSFPTRPDAEMETWHRDVTSRLKQDNYVRQRLKNSPYHSPNVGETMDGYFSPPLPKIRQPSRPRRQNSRDGDSAHTYSRRSSEPDWTNPVGLGDRHRESHNRDGGRSASGNRPPTASRQRSATTNSPIHPPRPTNPSRNSEYPPAAYDRWQHVDPARRNMGRRPSSSASTTSAEDASSEDSHRQSRSKRKKATSSLLSVLPFTTPWHKRSRSHDVSSRKDRVSPRRDDRDTPPPLRASTETFSRPPPSVRFRHDIFDRTSPNSAPESPVSGRRSQSGPRQDQRFTRNPTGPGLTDQSSPVNYNLTREISSGSGSERRSAYEIPTRQLRKVGTPQRPPTMTGVQGRKYASVEQTRDGPMPPQQPVSPVMPPQPDPRSQIRYSLAV